MHKLKEIKKALKLLDKYDGQMSKTARELGAGPHTLEYKKTLINDNKGDKQ